MANGKNAAGKGAGAKKAAKKVVTKAAGPKKPTTKAAKTPAGFTKAGVPGSPGVALSPAERKKAVADYLGPTQTLREFLDQVGWERR